MLRPVAYLAALLIFCFFSVLGHSVTTLNVMAKDQSTENMEMSLAALKRSLERVNIDYSWWDESLENLVIKRDQSWIEVNIAVDALNTTGTSAIFVADAQDTIWYAESTYGPLLELETLQQDLAVLFQSARAQQASNPLPHSGFVELGGKLYIISVAAITSQGMETSPLSLSNTQSILGFMQEIDSAQLTALGETLRVDDLQFHFKGSDESGASITLYTPSGRRLGAFNWQPGKPGTDFLLKMSTVGGSALLLVAIFTLVIFRRTSQVARQLAANERFLEEKNTKLETSLAELADANERVVQASQAKTEFLTNVSHELRTPLNAIIGFSEIISEQRMGNIGNQKYVEYAKDINQSGAHLLSLINEILDLSKIKSGQFNLSRDLVDLNAVAQSVAKLFQTSAKEKAITLTEDLAHEEIMIWADERAVRQVLINLIGNALKFTPEGGQITIKSEVTRDNEVCVHISDTGIGIPGDQIEIALAPFKQVDGRLARSHGGTGLGLPLSQQLMELHGGTLTIESTVHVGTIITVTFPAKCLRQVNRAAQQAS